MVFLRFFFAGVSVCMNVLGTITHFLCICHLAIKLYCIVLYNIQNLFIAHPFTNCTKRWKMIQSERGKSYTHSHSMFTFNLHPAVVVIPSKVSTSKLHPQNGNKSHDHSVDISQKLIKLIELHSINSFATTQNNT